MLPLFGETGSQAALRRVIKKCPGSLRGISVATSLAHAPGQKLENPASHGINPLREAIASDPPRISVMGMVVGRDNHPSHDGHNRSRLYAGHCDCHYRGRLYPCHNSLFPYPCWSGNKTLKLDQYACMDTYPGKSARLQVMVPLEQTSCFLAASYFHPIQHSILHSISIDRASYKSQVILSYL
jgi:hypothetical protein